MSIIDPTKIKLKVGLEIHQQLSTKNKLFCKCPNIEDDTADYKFERNLNSNPRAIKSVDGNKILYENGENQIVDLHRNTVTKYSSPEDKNLFEIFFRDEFKLLFFRKYLLREYTKYRDKIDDEIETIKFSLNLTLAITKLNSSKIFFIKCSDIFCHDSYVIYA